jgi:hypothetical protein
MTAPTALVAPATPVSQPPVEDYDAEGHLDRQRPEHGARVNRPAVRREQERDGEENHHATDTP